MLASHQFARLLRPSMSRTTRGAQTEGAPVHRAVVISQFMTAYEIAVAESAFHEDPDGRVDDALGPCTFSMPACWAVGTAAG